MSNIFNITMDQGSTLIHVFTINDQDGEPVNLTGYDVRMQVRQTYGATEVLVNCTLANGKLVLTDPGSGVLTLNLSPGDTSSIRFKDKNDETLECVYDLELQSPSGRVDKPARGTFTLNREVTR